MPLPIHHLKHLHHRVRHHLSSLNGNRLTVFVVAATLVLMPFALSPVSSDPAMAGQTALLLAAVTVLCLILAVKEVREQRTEKQINGEKTPFLRSSVLLALVLTLIMIVTSSNRTLALTSPQAKVVLVLLFFLAARRIIPVIAREHSDRGNHIEVASPPNRRVAMTNNGYMLIKKAWLTGLIVFGLLYLIFGSPLNLFKHLSGVQPSTWKVVNVAGALIAPQFNPIRPDWQTSLKVASETMIHSPLLGAGFGRYNSAFSAYRGAAFNASPLWNYKYSSSFSTLFNWVTEGGLVGVVIYLLLFLPAFRLVLGFVKAIFNLKFKIFSQFEMSKFLKIKSFKIKSLISNLKLQISNYRLIVAVLALSSLFFPFSLAGYFYLITGYLFIYEN